MAKLVSVTQALSPFSKFDQIPPGVLAAAIERGNALHNAFAGYCLGLWLPELAEDYHPYFDSFVNWFDATIQETLSVEEEMVCKKYGFIGHPDYIGIIKGDEAPVLIDWKSGQSVLKSHRLQLAAYHHLAREKYGVERVLLVHPKPDGKRAKVVEHSKTLGHDFSLFLNCLTAYKFFNGG